MRYLIFFIFLFILQADDGVTVKAEKSADNIFVFASNENFFPVTIGCDIEYNYLSSRQNISKTISLKPHTKGKILKIYIKKGGQFSYTADCDWIHGSKNAVHDDTYLYRLPYKRGTKHRVSQGFDGKFSHFGASRYAVDFDMKKGTKVYATRGGAVIQVKEDSNKGGASKAYKKDGNFISILHDDGTIGSYYHFKKNAVAVKVADKIERGQLIGYSGKTGYAQGPHLHFGVYKANSGKKREPVKIRFISKQGIINDPNQQSGSGDADAT